MKTGRDDLRDDLARACNNLGGTLRALGRHEDAEARYLQEIGILKLLVKTGRDDLRDDLARVYNNHSDVLLALEKPLPALEAAERACLILEPMIATSGIASVGLNGAAARVTRAKALHALGRDEDAIGAFDSAVEALKKLRAGGFGGLDAHIDSYIKTRDAARARLFAQAFGEDFTVEVGLIQNRSQRRGSDA